jgi:hypothetical protein
LSTFAVRGTIREAIIARNWQRNRRLRGGGYVRAYVGVTDGDWYRFLAARPDIAEVNFWQPSGGRAFRVLETGEPFLFKTHHPHNRVVGGGFFSGFAVLPLSEAWSLFGEANGLRISRRCGRGLVSIGGVHSRRVRIR